MLGTLGREPGDQNHSGGGHDKNDADHGLLGNDRVLETAEGKDECPYEGKAHREPQSQRCPVRYAHQKTHGGTERRDLCESEVHKNHPPGDDVKAQISVDRENHEAGHDRRDHEIEHGVLL